MRQVHGVRSPAPDQATPAAARDVLPVAEHCDFQAVYSADQAAIAFGIPRIAPVRMPRGASQPGLQPVSPPAHADFPATPEDSTESLIAVDPDAPVAFPEPSCPVRLAALPASPEPSDRTPATALADPVTTALRIPRRRDHAAPCEWSGPQPQTERLLVPASQLAPSPKPAPPRPARRLTAVLPQLGHLGRGPGEGATTTLTLPALPAGTAGLEFAHAHSPEATEQLQLVKWTLLGAGAAVALLLAMLTGRALTLADMWPGAALRPPIVPPRPSAVYRERLLEQATAALRDGRRDQAVGLLLRYQASEPAGSSDRTVELMLHVLKKDLGIPNR